MLSVEGVRVRFEDRWVLDGADLTVGPAEIVALLGPSGSGKSTLLRVIAGLLPPDEGRVLWDGEDVTAVPAHRRRFGLVFQDHQLFPHRDVAGNVGFGLAVAGRPKAEVRERVAELLHLVGLDGFERRSVTALSGGEAQRVALARALAPQPRLLLLDEPLAALDRELHDRLAVDLRHLLQELGISGPARDARPGRSRPGGRPHRHRRRAPEGLTAGRVSLLAHKSRRPTILASLGAICAAIGPVSDPDSAAHTLSTVTTADELRARGAAGPRRRRRAARHRGRSGSVGHPRSHPARRSRHVGGTDRGRASRRPCAPPARS